MKVSTSGAVDSLEAFDNGTCGFRATQTGGSDLDLVELAGLSFLQELIYELVLETNWDGILHECVSATVIEEEEFEGGPGQSDTFYRVEVDDLESLRREVKTIYLERLDQSLRTESTRCRGMKARRPRISVAVEWGYDVHDLLMALDTFRRVLKGKPMMRVRHYWHEGERYRGEWSFNKTRPWELEVGHDDGGVAYVGSLADATVRLDRGS